MQNYFFYPRSSIRVSNFHSSLLAYFFDFFFAADFFAPAFVAVMPLAGVADFLPPKTGSFTCA
jgi:hypothetical protein